MNYDSFDNKYFLKGWYFLRHTVFFTFFRLYKYIQSVFYCKTDFGFAATILITLQFKQRLGFHLEMIVLAFFNFVLGGYYNQINNLAFYGYDFFKCSS
jgi:hypothetical protein